MSTTLTLTPLDDRGREILDQFESGAAQPFRSDRRTGARAYWRNAPGAPVDGYEAALDRLAPDWREHLRPVPSRPFALSDPPTGQRGRDGIDDERLVEIGLDRIGDLTPHSLRRLYASLRFALGDDPVYVANQLGHTEPGFSMKVYASAVRRRERLIGRPAGVRCGPGMGSNGQRRAVSETSRTRAARQSSGNGSAEPLLTICPDSSAG